MKKQYLLTCIILLVLILLLSGCKNAKEQTLEEKKACYRDCMLEEEDKEYCLEECDLKESDLEEIKPSCGDSVCDAIERQNALCPEDCPGSCTTDADCEEQEVCTANTCTPVECTLNEHCEEGMECQENVCVEEEVFDTAVQDALKEEINAMIDDIDALLAAIDALQTSLDAADGSDEEKAAIQEDIDALDSAMTSLEGYKDALNQYLEDAEAATTNDEVSTVETAFDAAKEEIESLIDDTQTDVDAVEEAIDALEPAAQADLEVSDLDLEEVDGQTATFTISFENNGDGNITTSQSFRIELTSYDLDNETNDDSRATITSGINAGEEEEVEMSVEIIDLEDYFSDNPNASSLILPFFIEIDIDGTINETDETNNNKTINMTFDREDYFTNTAPVAAVSANATTVLVNEEISFDGTGSTDSDGSLASYYWDFGDSNYSSSSTPTHSYTTAGTYTVTLTVTDNDGGTDTETVTITVS